MQLYGKYDDGFGDMGDFTGKTIIGLDFNAVAPLLQRKPKKAFSICETSFNKLFNIFLKKTTKQDRKSDLLVLMRIKKGASAKKVAEMGHKISSKMDQQSLVTWTAQEYDRVRFDFYFYDSPKVKTRPIKDISKFLKSKEH